MKTIVEPKQNIAKLWGKQRVKPDATYRLMRYLLRVEHEGHTLLHNVVTGQLVVLDEEEARDLDNLPHPYTEVLVQLVTDHYLVPEEYDEFQQVINLRKILQKLDEAQETKGVINHYTILPTTACNARCYYCFEQGTKPITMTEQTADDVVRFIKAHCGGKSVLLSWFGGEPTLAVDRIDQICKGLQTNCVEYLSEITTNGYLFDEELIEKAKKLWMLKSAMICVDGTEDNYNKTKCFVYNEGSPYQRVMNNIGLLLKQGIRVHLRMNFDVTNHGDFADLVEDACKRYKGFDNLGVSAHPINGEYRDHTGKVNHGTFAWFETMVGRLNDIANDAGLQHRDMSLPWLKHRTCMAASNSSVTITADGNLVSCPEQFGSDQWKGSLTKGITNDDMVKKWKKMAVFEKCLSCVSFPDCVTMANCATAGNCCTRKEIEIGQRQAMIQVFCKTKMDSKA